MLTVPRIVAAVSCMGTAFWLGAEKSEEAIATTIACFATYLGLLATELLKKKRENQNRATIFQERNRLLEEKQNLIAENEAQSRALKQKKELITHYKESISKLSNKIGRNQSV